MVCYELCYVIVYSACCVCIWSLTKACMLHSEPEIPDITADEEGGEGDGEGQGGETETPADEPEQALPVSSPTEEDDAPKKGYFCGFEFHLKYYLLY